ncbi:MAG: hypothetical protein ACRCYX_04320 [Dermatophilaceae bacterium]
MDRPRGEPTPATGRPTVPAQRPSVAASVKIHASAASRAELRRSRARSVNLRGLAVLVALAALAGIAWALLG